jgi:hypothetical protein
MFALRGRAYIPTRRLAVPVGPTAAVARTLLDASTICTVPPGGAPDKVTDSPNVE